MKLPVESRTIFGKKTKLLRQKGQVPAVIYGKHLDQSLHILIDKEKLVKTYHATGMSTPIQLMGSNIDQLVLFQYLQLDPVTDRVVHVEFLAVNKDEKVSAEVPLHLVGESFFEKNGFGRIQLLRDSIAVTALPLDLPHDIQIDISHIEHEGQVIHVSDLQVSDKVEIDEDMETPVVTSIAYREEKEEVVEVVTVTEGVGEESDDQEKDTDKDKE